MEIVIIRHGPAEPAAAGRSDADRSLTRSGREQTLLAAQGLARAVDRPGVLLSSPKKRAHQTASIVGEVFDLAVETRDELGDESVPRIERMLRSRSEQAVALVGHEPTLGRLAAALLGVGARDGAIVVKKASAVVIQAPLHEQDIPGPARLELLLPPRVLRMLGGGRG